jgi:hypothetical protein
LRARTSTIAFQLEAYRSCVVNKNLYGALAALASARELGRNIEAELMDFQRLSAAQLSQITRVFVEDVTRADFLIDYAGKLVDEEVILVLSLRLDARLVEKLIGDQLPSESLLKLNNLNEKIEELKVDPTFARQLARCNATIKKNIGFDI